VRTQSRTIEAHELDSVATQKLRTTEGLIHSWHDTPGWKLVSSRQGVTLQKLRAGDYDNYWVAGKHPLYKVSGLGAGQSLDLVALMPVSGHVGGSDAQKLATAQHYAATNTYRIEVRHPDGQVEFIEHVQSKALVTPHELSVRLQPGNTIFRFTPEATSVEGYLNGRMIEVQWDGRP
jgi:hypothetical protein